MKSYLPNRKQRLRLSIYLVNEQKNEFYKFEFLVAHFNVSINEKFLHLKKTLGFNYLDEITRYSCKKPLF